MGKVIGNTKVGAVVGEVTGNGPVVMQYNKTLNPTIPACNGTAICKSIIPLYNNDFLNNSKYHPYFLTDPWKKPAGKAACLAWQSDNSCPMP